MELEKTAETYSRSEIRRILSLKENSLRAWERLCLVRAQDSYDFEGLIALRTLQRLKESKVSPTKMQKVMHSLRLRLSEVEKPLQELKIVSDGTRILVELPGAKIEALTGQMLFQFDTKALHSVATIKVQSEVDGYQRLSSTESLFQYALDLERAGAHGNDVIEVYEKVLSLNPDAAGALINLGTQFYLQDRFSRAEKCYEKALKIFPGYPLAHYNLGNLHEQAARLEEAVIHYRSAILHEESYADAYYNLALVYERLEQFGEARNHWQAYLKLDPSGPWATIARQKQERLDHHISDEVMTKANPTARNLPDIGH